MTDDDLIRRGDALNAVQGWTYCCNAEDEIAALPAVTAHGVLTDADREWIDARADELFREDQRSRGAVSLNTVGPTDYRDYFVVSATAERLAAIAPAQPALTPKPVDDSLAADPAVKEWNAAIKAAAEVYAAHPAIEMDRWAAVSWQWRHQVHKAILALLKEEKK